AAVLASVLGFFIGAGLHALPRLRRPLLPLLSAYYAVPTFVFYPLLIVAFGIGRTALIVMGAMFGVVAMILNTTLGLDHVPPAVDRTGAILRLDRLRRLVLVRLPAPAPPLVTRIKLPGAYSVIRLLAGAVDPPHRRHRQAHFLLVRQLRQSHDVRSAAVAADRRHDRQRRAVGVGEAAASPLRPAMKSGRLDYPLLVAGFLALWQLLHWAVG